MEVVTNKGNNPFWRRWVEENRENRETKKRRKREVSFYAFVPALRHSLISFPPYRTYNTYWEKWIEEEMKSASMAFLVGRMGLLVPIDGVDKDGWSVPNDGLDEDGVDQSYWFQPWSSKEKELEDTTEWYSEVNKPNDYFGAWQNKWHDPKQEFDSEFDFFVNPSQVVRDTVLPAAAAYVLNGRLKSRLKSFHGDYYGWLFAIRQNYVGGKRFGNMLRRSYAMLPGVEMGMNRPSTT